jgi:hypothetical protein
MQAQTTTTGFTAILRQHAENGTLDRMAGSAIQTKDQYREANPTFTGEDAADIYRAYRAGYTR